jgi:hypothetical protein
MIKCIKEFTVLEKGNNISDLISFNEIDEEKYNSKIWKITLNTIKYLNNRRKENAESVLCKNLEKIICYVCTHFLNKVSVFNIKNKCDLCENNKEFIVINSLNIEEYNYMCTINPVFLVLCKEHCKEYKIKIENLYINDISNKYYKKLLDEIFYYYKKKIIKENPYSKIYKKNFCDIYVE